MERGALWQHRLWPFSHIVVGDGTGTEFALSQKDQKNVHESLHVYLTLCVEGQVYCVFDLLGLSTRYSKFGLTIPIQMTPDMYVYSPKPYIIVCGLTEPQADTLCKNWKINSLILYGKWGGPKYGFVVWAINKSIANTLRDIVEKSTDRLRVTRYLVALRFSPPRSTNGLGSIQNTPDTLPASAYFPLFPDL